MNLVHAREGVMSSSVFDDDLYKLFPIIEPDMSDSGCFDNVVEFLCYAGQRQLPEVSASVHLVHSITSQSHELI